MKKTKPHPAKYDEPTHSSGDETIATTVSWTVVGIAILLLISSLRPKPIKSAFNLSDFGKLPVLNGGRIKPLDTVARTSLLMLSGKQTLKNTDGRLSAIEWLLDMMFKSSAANNYAVLEINDPDVLGILNIPQTKQRLFPFYQLQPHLGEIEKQASLADGTKPETRTRYQSAIVNLQSRIYLYQKLQNTLQIADASNISNGLHYFEAHVLPATPEKHVHPFADHKHTDEFSRFMAQFRFLAQVSEFYPVPESPDMEKPHWSSIGDSLASRVDADAFHPAILAYAFMADAYRNSDSNTFNRALADYRSWLSSYVPKALSWTGYEFIFNSFDPFYRSLLIYLATFLLVFSSWLIWPKTLSRSAFTLLLLALAVHTVGLISRMIIQGRPPVTNLYSSAIFVGWIAVLLATILEHMFRRGVGTLVASSIGVLTLIVAMHLNTQGDTMEMMRAVLDSNFWLATHVTCITIGYSSTFLSGFLGSFYIFQRIFAPRHDEVSDETLGKMVFGVVCFSTFFSFLGTILGGIWADQSWGRFWGWDPKENGALMIVLWNVAILHARWGGMIRTRGLMVAAVFGNIVTSLSWFGVNMLGIGLHSYGFMDKAFVWLMIFVASQLAIMAAGLLPDSSDN